MFYSYPFLFRKLSFSFHLLPSVFSIPTHFKMEKTQGRRWNISEKLCFLAHSWYKHSSKNSCFELYNNKQHALNTLQFLKYFSYALLHLFNLSFWDGCYDFLHFYKLENQSSEIHILCYPKDIERERGFLPFIDYKERFISMFSMRLANTTI